MGHVFAVFPELFFLSPLAVTLLRISCAYAFLYLASSLMQNRRGIARARFPVLGHPPLWMIWIAAVASLLIGVMLAIGLYTQIAAILGALFLIKHALWSRWDSSIAPLSRGTLALLLVICASLVITGAGAFAFDLPF